MKIFEITEALTKDHVDLLNRLRAEGPEARALAGRIQRILAKSRVSWDVAAELARNEMRKERDAADKKAGERDIRRNPGAQPGNKNAYKGGGENPVKSRTGDKKFKGDNFKGDGGLTPAGGEPEFGDVHKSINRRLTGKDEPVKDYVKGKYKDYVSDPIDDIAGDSTRSPAARGSAKLARALGRGVKDFYKSAKGGK